MKEVNATREPSQTPTYKSWHAMRYRCLSEKATSFKHYGGRGVLVSLRWLNYQNFFEDMGERPAGTTLDRIDANKGYYRENCRWASNKTQARNKRNLRFLTIDGVQKCLVEWEEHHGLPYGILRQRLNLGWGLERLFSQPRKSTSCAA